VRKPLLGIVVVVGGIVVARILGLRLGSLAVSAAKSCMRDVLRGGDDVW